MEPTKASELVKKVIKLVECKSGNVYKIRKMPLAVMAGFFNSIELKLSQDMETMQTSLKEQLSDPAKTEKLILAMRGVLPQCILEPKVSSTEPSTDAAINVDDIPIEDQFELFGVITDFSGISAEALKKTNTSLKV